MKADEAQTLVNRLAEYPSPLIFVDGDYRRVLKAKLKLRPEILLLLGSVSDRLATTVQLSDWTGQANRTYIRKVLAEMDGERLVRFNTKADSAQLLPPGQVAADLLAQEHAAA